MKRIISFLGVIIMLSCGSAFAEDCSKFGDVNSDGEVNVLDVVATVSYVIGTGDLSDDALACADINGDESINVLDIVILVGLILGEAEAPPTESNSIQWTAQGPGGGGHWRSIAIHPTDPNIVLAGSDVTGVYKTTDGGANWQIASGFANPDSTHMANSTWRVVFAADASTVYHCSTVGIMKSTDSGSTFERKEFGASQGGAYNLYNSAKCGAITVDPDDPNKVWAGSGEPRKTNYEDDWEDSKWAQNRVWRTEDGFDTVSSALFDTTRLDFIPTPENPKPVPHSFLVDRSSEQGKRHLLSHSLTQLFESFDDGKSWSLKESKWYNSLGQQFTIKVGIRNMEIVYNELDTAEDDVIYAVLLSATDEVTDPSSGEIYRDQSSWQGGVYRSLDWGATWKERNGTTGPNLALDGGFEGADLAASGWSKVLPAAATGADVSMMEDAARSGDKGIRITSSSEENKSIGFRLAEKIAVQEFQRYGAEMWVRQETSAGVSIQIGFYDDEGNPLDGCFDDFTSGPTEETTARSLVKASAWRLIRGEARAPAGAVKAMVRVVTWNQTSGTLDIDDVSIHASMRLPWGKNPTGEYENSWSQYNHIAIHPQDEDQLYVSSHYTTRDGVWGSKDGGLTWEHLSRKSIACHGNISAPFRHRIPSLTGSSTMDWTLDVGGDSSSPTVIYATRFWIIRSDDGGQTWILNVSHENAEGDLVGHGDINNTYVTTLAFHPTDASRYYYGDADNLMFWTANAGASWKYEGVAESGYNAWTTDAAADIVVDPANPDILWVHGYGKEQLITQLGTGNLMRYDMSTAGGATYEVVSDSTYPTGGKMDLSIDESSPAGNRTFYGGVWMRGVFKSVNGGVTWTSLGADGDYNDWSPSPPHDGVTVLERNDATGRLIAGFGNANRWNYEGGLWVSDNDGESWTGLNTDIFANYKAQIEQVTFLANNHILVAVDEGAISKEETPLLGKGGIWRGLEDSDGNWEWRQTLVLPAMTSVVVSPHDPNTIYAAASHVNFRSNNQWAGIYRSRDKGETWTYLEAPGLGSLSHMTLYPSPHDSTKMYLGTWGGGLFVGEL